MVPVSEQQRAVRLLTENDAKKILRTAGIAVPRGVTGTTAVEAAANAVRLRFPVVAKVLSRDLMHKSDHGGVRVGLTSVDEVLRAGEDILDSVRRSAPNASIDGLLVEEMAGAGTELLVGTVHDTTFGSVIALGLGGLFTEVFEDITFRVVPIQWWDAHEMIEDLSASRLLDGYRGSTPVDRDALAGLLLAVGGAEGLLARAGVHSVELNPVIAAMDRLLAVDAAIELDDQATS